MRRSYLVTYDIRDPKRLRRVFKTMKGYGEHWQLSVFFCTLRRIDHARLQADLADIIHHGEDQILIIDMGPGDHEARESITVLGPALPAAEEGYVVV